MSSKFVSYVPQSGEHIPIFKAKPTAQKPVAIKVDVILSAKAADPADTTQLEREIDELVADLYGLDAEEKKLVGIG